MKSNKRFLSLLTCLLLSGTLTCYSKVFAASENTIIQNTQPNIVINNSGEYIPNEVIQDIIRDNPGTQNIIIYEYYETEKNALSSFSINALPKVWTSLSFGGRTLCWQSSVFLQGLAPAFDRFRKCSRFPSSFRCPFQYPVLCKIPINILCKFYLPFTLKR